MMYGLSIRGRIAFWGRAIAVVLVFMSAARVHAQSGVGYVYAYFQGPWPTGGSSGVFLSFSSDGLNFSPLNNGNAVILPPQPPSFPSGENLMRDPSVTRGPDGLFHMVWTSGITTRTIGYSSSPDLMTWSAPQRVQVWSPSTTVDNTWAPEIMYDEVAGQYQIVFASDVNDGYHRLYSLTTTNFQNYSTPQLFYDNGNTVIDGMIAEDLVNNQFVMAIKDELGGAKNIWLATSNSASGPFVRGSSPVIGPGTGVDNNAVEGPSLIKIGDLWHLYYDAYGANYLGVATSPDLTTWTNRTGQSAQPQGHHGTVFAAPLTSIGWLVERSDLNDDGVVDIADWAIFRTYNHVDMSGWPAALRASRGDLNNSGTSDFDDLYIFQSDYDLFHGDGGLAAAMRAAPEPDARVLLCCALLLTLARRTHRPM